VCVSHVCVLNSLLKLVKHNVRCEISLLCEGEQGAEVVESVVERGGRENVRCVGVISQSQQFSEVT